MGVLFQYETPELELRHVVDRHPDDQHFGMHVHEGCEIYCYLSGNVKYLVEGYEYSLEPGSIMIMRPSEFHRAVIMGNKTYERYYLNFFASAVERMDSRHRLLKPFMDRPLGCGNIYRPSDFKGVQPLDLFEKMCSYAEDDYGRELKVYTLLFSVLDLINEAYLKKGSAEYEPPQSLAERMVAYINAHLFEELSVPGLAGRFYLSTSQFGRIFKQATGSSPWEYITIKRLTAVREKIHSGLSVREASTMCGFADYSAFYRAYVKYFGCAPKYDKG